MRYIVTIHYLMSNFYKDITDKENVFVIEKKFKSKRKAKKFINTVLYKDSKDNVITYICLKDTQKELLLEIGVPCIEE